MLSISRCGLARRGLCRFIPFAQLPYLIASEILHPVSEGGVASKDGVSISSIQSHQCALESTAVMSFYLPACLWFGLFSALNVACIRVKSANPLLL
eukprot:4553711-Pleurochrysis_carterae.AAC.2